MTDHRTGALLFAAGYLLVWSVAGIGAYGLFELGKSLFAGSLAWHSGGRLPMTVERRGSEERDQSPIRAPRSRRISKW